MFKLSSMVMMALAFAAPMVNVAANPAAPGCGKWRSHFEIQGSGLIKPEFQIKDHHWCRKECMKMPECVAATWLNSHRKCGLYRATADGVVAAKRGKSVLVFCPTCNKQIRGQKIEGGTQIMDPFQIKDSAWCRKKCLHKKECNAYNWGPGRMCTLLTLEAGDFKLRQGVSHYHSYIVCDRYSLLPDCGGKGEPICPESNNCEPGLTTTNDQTCDCGGEWETCCAGIFAKDGPCDAGLDCNNDKRCAPCGGQWETCCANNKCNSDDGQRRVCMWNHCRPCGGQWQDVCEGTNKCDMGLMPDMHGGTQCVMMGADK